MSNGRRHPAVAGAFYPAQAHVLQNDVRSYLGAASPAGAPPKAVIAPHAGYMYSGPVAGRVFALLRPGRNRIRRVVLAGPAHRLPFRGLAVPSATAFETPLGEVPVDMGGVRTLLKQPQVQTLDEAHAMEHCLEVELPFLQEVLSDFSIVPFLTGMVSPEETAEALRTVWGGDETLVVISSDLSHYLDYRTAQSLDRQTSEAIEHLQPEQLRHEQACGATPIAALLLIAREKGLTAERVDLRTSGDTAGPRDQVVGYGAYAFTG